MRPIYQEVILPNVLYYGGGAEVAYWLELKSTFESFGVPYPVLGIRNAFVMVNANTRKRMGNLGIDHSDLFLKKVDLERKILAPSFELGTKLESAILQMEQAIQRVDFIADTPMNLHHSAEIAQNKISKAIRQLEKKAFSAHKRNHVQQLAHLSDVLNEIFVGGTFQERKVNGFDLQLQLGQKWIPSLLQISDPFCGQLTIVEV
jgi:uncharacterized protein YllA (UPF0747 family)